MTPARLPLTAASSPAYQRHQPETTLLYQTIADLCSQVLGLLTQAVRRWYRHTAKKVRGLFSVKLAHSGSVACIQRFSSALDLHLHFHALVLDGVCVEEARYFK